MKTKIGVLFLQCESQFSSIAMIHSLLMRYFDREHIEVHVACTAGIGREKPPSLQAFETIPELHVRPTVFSPTIFRRSKMDIVRSMISTGIPAMVSIAGLVRYVKQHDIDIIHWSERPRDAFYSVLLARLTGTKSILHLHGKCDTWMGSLALWAMEQADGIIGVSQFVAQSAIAKGYRPDKVYHVLNSIDASHWNYDTDRSAVRREFGISPDAPLLAIISRILPWKGQELLLNALVKVKDQVPGVKLLIVGEGDSSTMPMGRNYMVVLKEMVRELKLSEQVIFTGHRSDVQEILAACDLYTMPTFEEPFGVVFLEAMAMKKPIIALNSGGAPEAIEHGKAGLLSPPGDISQLAENILGLINNPALREQMGEYGRARVEQYFNPCRMADDVERIYQLVLGKTVMSRQEQMPAVETPHHR